jgi:hypothetical protein
MPQGGYIYRMGTSAQTESVISSRFKIFSPAVDVGKFVKLGVTSQFNISESKTVDPVRGLGYGDIVAELVPGVTNPTELTITRTCLYLANLMQMMGYKAGISGLVRSIKHHKWPFDIKTEIVFSELANSDSNLQEATLADIPNEGGLNNLGNPGLHAVATLYEGCWFSNYGTGYAIDTAMVNEDATIVCTDIFDVAGSVYGEFIDAGNAPTDVTSSSLLYTI